MVESRSVVPFVVPLEQTRPEWFQLAATFLVVVCLLAQDSLPEWSKGVDSSSTSASCVGSNPTGVMSIGTVLRLSLRGAAATFWESTSVDDGAAVCPPQAP